MTKDELSEYKNMVKTYQDRDEPTAWFDTIYKNAKGDYTNVFWADLCPNPYLVNWLERNPISNKQKAIVIGCGVGDDCEALSSFGFEVIGFDISPSAIELCKNRYPDSNVSYLVADLFDYNKEWLGTFDVVYECNTIQVLPGDYRIKARVAMSRLLNKNGHILVSCRSRKEAEQLNDIPLPLDKKEISAFVTQDKLKEISFLAYDDNQTPRVPHFFGIYKKIL